VIYELDNNFEFQGVIKPGADLITVTKTSKEDVKNLTNKDVAVEWGGTKDVGKNYTRNGCYNCLI
jgi:hypothetical protein